MRRLAQFVSTLLIVIPVVCVSCSPNPPSSESKKVQPVYDVNFRVLVRDFQTADGYTGKRVRVRLEKDEYAVSSVNDAFEVHVWATERSAPPVLVFKCANPFPAGVPIVVSGTCRPPVRDNVWRAPRVNFFVVIEDCLVTAR